MWLFNVLAEGTYTQSFVTRSLTIAEYRELVLYVAVNSVVGTNATLVPRFVVSFGDGNWSHLATVIDTSTQGDLTRLTAPVNEGKLRNPGIYTSHIVDPYGTLLRCEVTLGGTNPSFNLTLGVWLR